MAKGLLLCWYISLIGLSLAIVFGWVMNIIYLIQNIDLLSLGYLILGVVGVFVAPLGSIMYWFVW